MWCCPCQINSSTASQIPINLSEANGGNKLQNFKFKFVNIDSYSPVYAFDIRYNYECMFIAFNHYAYPCDNAD